VSEFGSRRAHGPWAAVYGAKAAVIAGCSATSNIMTGAMFDYGSTGTMAHSYVTSYGCSVEGEFHAFSDYIKTHKGESLILLIDTYDTLKCGVLNAMRAFRENGVDDTYSPGYGVRLDSGDLAYLSIEVREILNANGFKNCKIFATNSLDEYLITDLERQGACIDSYGVGDAIATSKANPCFGNVYKLVEIGGEAVLKRSEDKIKLINPGFQITYRITKLDPVKGDIFKVDVTCLKGDQLSKQIEAGEEFTVCDEFDRYKTKTFLPGEYSAKPLQTLAMENGKRCDTRYTLLEKKEQISVIIDEYGSMRGIVTMEDVIETMLGQEIVDETDEVVDMQEYAKEQWEKAQKDIIKAE
jgi:nicotinate phosphoribosyltransferase